MVSTVHLMKADPADELEKHGGDAAGAAEMLDDPFAVDLFAASRERSAPAQVTPLPADSSAQPSSSSNNYAEQAGEQRPARTISPWNAALPRLSRLEAQFSTKLASLPPSLSSRGIRNCARIIARLAHATPYEVTFETVSVREVSLGEWLTERAGETAPRLFVSVAIEPSGAHVIAEMDAGFASALTRRMLGDDAVSAEPLRALSKTERAIIEFLCLSVIRDLNETAGEPLLRLAIISDEPPAHLVAHNAKARGANSQAHARALSSAEARSTRGIVLTVRARIGSTVGLLRFVCDAAALDALDARRNPLLSDENDDEGAAHAVLARYGRFASAVALHLLIGETEVDVPNLAELESGDVVLIERSFVNWLDGRISGAAHVRAGDGASVRIEGDVQTSTALSVSGREDAQGQSAAGEIRLAVRAVFTQQVEGADAERFGMEEERESIETDGEGAGVLDALLLTVRVELAARRLTLDELARLRAGQILELGCRPTDPVDLVADGRRIASGELVDVDGQLGVRVTRLLS